jgi:predicted permease
LALGASRGRLARQLFTESLLLAVPGALLGLLFAQWGSRLLLTQIRQQGGPGGGGPVILDLSLHWRVLLFTLVVTLLTAVLFGVGPALRASRSAPSDVMKQQGRGVAGGPRGVLGGPLLAAQVALSLVLLFGAGLFLGTFSRLAHRDLGLDGDGILLVKLDLQRSAARDAERLALFARIQEAVAALPGVAHATVSTIGPLSGQGWNLRFTAEGLPKLGDRESIAWVNAVTPGFFAAYRTPFRAGRDIDVTDRAGTPKVALVNEAFARRFFGGESPVGRRISAGDRPDRPPRMLEVVGVVGDAVYRSAREQIDPTVYLPLAQLAPDEVWPFAALAVRAASGPPALLGKAVTAAVADVDPRVSLSLEVFSSHIGATLLRERLMAWLSAFFAGLALLLAGIGLFGVTSYAVNRRRTEIGVRMALGAEARGVVRMVLAETLRPVATGLLLGALASLAAARLVGSLLFGIDASDLPTLVTAALVLIAICIAASGLPARRASRIDPAEVLRES